MKQLIRSAKFLLVFLGMAFTVCITASCAQAQQSPADWRLENKQHEGAGSTSEYRYQYDKDGNVTKVDYWQDKKSFYTESSFVADEKKRITSFTRTYVKAGVPAESNIIQYGTDGNMSLYVTSIIKNGKKVIIKSRDYEWLPNKVIEYLGGKSTATNYGRMEYLFTNEGNIKERQEYNTEGKKINAPFIYNHYDNSPNPDKLRGNYSLIEISSANNFLDWIFNYDDGKTTNKISYTYNTDKFPKQQKIEYVKQGMSWNPVHTETYFYKKTRDKMNTIFDLAKTYKTATIKKYIYDGKEVYALNNGMFFYADGRLAFSRISEGLSKFIYVPATIEAAKLQPTLGSWTRNANGEYIALR